jgi:predicted PurR-regulated permease PerM
MPLTRVTVPTTETTAKDVPDLTSDDIALPSELKTVLLAGLFLFAALTAAYVAAEVILPIVLAMVLTLLLLPEMRLLNRLHVPRSLSALLLILAALTGIFALGAAVSGPAKTWAGRLPDGVPIIEERLRFLSRTSWHKVTILTQLPAQHVTHARAEVTNAADQDDKRFGFLN